MSKIISYPIILLIFFSFFIINASANVNLTFQSDNEKVIKIINIDNNYTMIGGNTNVTNESINLTYNNYIVKLYASNTNLSEGNNGSTILVNMQAIKNDRYTVIWIIIVLALIWYAVLYLTRT